jgi:hypothetical protein
MWTLVGALSGIAGAGALIGLGVAWGVIAWTGKMNKDL